MNRVEFWILNFASLLIAGVIGFEMYSSHQLDETQDRAAQAQVPILQDQQMQPLARQMVQRIAQGSLNDPALKDLLTKYGFQITMPKTDPTASASLAAPTNPANP